LALDAGQVSLDVHPDVTGFAAELKTKLLPIANKAERDLNKIGVSRSVQSRLFGFLDMAGGKFGQLNRTIRGVGGSAGGLGKIFGLIKWPAIISGVDVLAAGIGALAAGTIQLIAGLAPLTGILVLYPAIMGAVGQAAGVVMLAFSGLSTAIKLAKTGGAEYQAALEALSPVQRAFVKQLVDTKEQFMGLKEIAAGELLPGLGDAMQRLTRLYMPAVQEAVRSTASELSKLADKFTNLFTSQGFITDITSISQNNVVLLGNLGTAALGFADGLRHIVAEAQPFVLWMGRALETIGTDFATRMEELRTSGSIAAFFDKTRTSASAFGDILSNVSHALFNVLQIAQPLGQTMLEGFASATQGWQEFTESVSGRSAIFDFFQEAQPTLHAISRLIRDIVSAFFELARSPGMAEVIDALRTQLLPLIVSIGQTASGQLLPALIDLGKQFLRIFQAFGSETPVLINFVKIMTGFVTVVLDVLDTVPGLKTLVVTLAALSRVFGILGVGTLIKVITQFHLYNAVLTQVGGTTTTFSSIISKVGAGFSYFGRSVLNVAKGITGIGTVVTTNTGAFSAFGQSLGSAALGGVALGVALGLVAKAAIEAADKVVTANTMVAESAGKSAVQSLALFKMTAAEFAAMAAEQDAAAHDVSFWDDFFGVGRMGSYGSAVNTVTSSFEQLEKQVLSGKMGLDQAGVGFQTIGFNADQTRVELTKLTEQMFNQGKITREQLVTRLMSLGSTYEEATGRANSLNQTLRVQGGVIGGVTNKVRVFAFSSMEAFTAWSNNVKTSFRSFVEGAKTFREAFNLNTRSLIKQMRLQVRVARQGALDMAELGDLAIPPKFKAWLMTEGPATVRAFVEGNETEQGIMRKAWTKTNEFIKKYGTEVDNLPKTAKTTARFDAAAATVALEAYRRRLMNIQGNTEFIPPIHPPSGGGPNPGGEPFAQGGIVTRPIHALIGEAGPEAVIPLDKLQSGPMRVEITDSNLDLIMYGVVNDQEEHLARQVRSNR